MELKDWDLHKAAELNLIDIAKILIENGVDVNKTDKYVKTPLYRASEKDYYKVAKILIENGADNTAGSPIVIEPLLSLRPDFFD